METRLDGSETSQFPAKHVSLGQPRVRDTFLTESGFFGASSCPACSLPSHEIDHGRDDQTDLVSLDRALQGLLKVGYTDSEPVKKWLVPHKT